MQHHKNLLQVHKLLESNLTDTIELLDLPESDMEANNCKICFKNPIVILNCGHEVICANCGVGLAICPICRAVIVAIKKT